MNGDTNNNTLNKRTTSMRKSNSIKPSRSHGNLVENKFYMSDDADVLTKEKKNLVKRTKSFWKFGKNASDNEILEGMALWRHRDLVDVNDEKNKLKRKINSQERVRRPSRDKSNDSDRTINNNMVNNREKAEEKQKGNKTKDIRHSKSFNEKPKSKQPSKVERDDYKAYKKSSSPTNFDDQFYDDDGDGLMLKTVNRKNILQQYSNDSTGSESDAESDLTSDDPYDSILIDDQKVKKNENPFPNVAELGKKLEKLSKSSKYSPNKDNNLNNQNRNTIQEKNNINSRLDRNGSVKNSPDRENEDIYQYHDKRHTNSFKTFGIDPQNNENEKKEELDDRYYSQTNKRNNETSAQDKRRYYSESNNNRNNSADRRGRPSYESIDSDVERRNRDNRMMTSNRKSHDDPDNKRDKMAKYYDSTNDELSDAVDNKQFLPRTKLTKTNSNNSTHSKYEQEIGLMEYGETLQKRLKNPEYNSKFDEKSPHNGNMYGPWYDLWGLDSTGTSPRK